MTSKPLWKLLRLTRVMWIRMSLIALLSVFAAVASVVLHPFIPAFLNTLLTSEGVMPVLTILASSMLAVVTFSLSVMVTAHQAASSQVTPRAHRLLLEDTTTQTVLATFLGAFIFALVSIIVISAELYGGRSVAVIFIVALFVIGLVVVAILRWIEHLSSLGSMDDTTRMVERVAKKGMAMRMSAPCMKAQPLKTVPKKAKPLPANAFGYVQFIDISSLTASAEKHDLKIYIHESPGHFVTPESPLLSYVGQADDIGDHLRNAFVIDDMRTFDQDPRFGLIVLAEIAARALSPGINDAGTAIDIITRSTGILSTFKDETTDTAKGHPNVFVAPLSADDLIEDAFSPIIRDGAGVLEVQTRVMKSLSYLATHDTPALANAARKMAKRALGYAEDALLLDEDKARLRALMPKA
ncbi:DUF2254 domain-containing protein [Pseudogemmobacter sp. W21_MBD1_M6]|uniref:DUF2254 domain-containing protein n=1 Tax=Pseudogemmobacter sp. W21_MBD1_M6 TaxID=3240271 RepID=UPI003F9C2101